MADNTNAIRIKQILEAVELALRGEYPSDLDSIAGDDDIGRLAQAVDNLQKSHQEQTLASNKYWLESQEQSRLLIDSLMDAYATVDLSGHITDANTAFRTMLGYSMEELGRLTYEDLTPKKWHDAELEIIENQVLKHGYSEVFEKEYIRKDGTVFPVELRTFLMRDSAGHEIGMWAIARDITQRKEIERELLVNQFCLNKALMGVFRMGNDGRILSANEQACKSLGYTREELLNLTVFDIDPVTNPEEWEDHRRNLMTSGIRTFETIHRRKDGSIFPVEVTVNYIEFENDIYSFSFAVDITDKKQAEENKAKLEAQLMQAQKMEAVGQLAGGIAHDFNNLLQSISGFAQLLLLDKPDKDPDYSRLKGIRDAALRAGDLTRQLLTVSRNIDSDLKPVNLNREIHQAVELMERTIPKMVEIVLVLDDNLHEIKADSNQLLQIFMNLSINASQAMPDGGTLVIETRNAFLDQEYCQTHLGAKAGEYVVLTVSDTGVGMEREVMDRIFEPFFTTKELGQGTGLGLSMVYGIVKNHNAYIHCYSEPGQGTSFNIYFPSLVDVPDHARFQPSRESLPQGTETILLVDDEPEVLWVGRDMLERFGYKVVTAGSGESALEQYTLNRDQIDMVMLDLNMPGMGGHKCLEELIRLDPEIKVIVSSGYSPNVSIRRILEAGAGSFVGKPFHLADMLNEVRRVLDS